MAFAPAVQSRRGSLRRITGKRHPPLPKLYAPITDNSLSPALTAYALIVETVIPAFTFVRCGRAR